MLTPTSAPWDAAPPALPKPGELWLLDRTTGAPRCALATSPRAEGELTDHKLVLGPSGAGRTLLLARLGKAAHDAGKMVVLIEQSSRGEASALRQLTHRLGGRALSLHQGVGFNPFWIPALDGEGWQPPTDRVVEELFRLLLGLFDLDTALETRPKLRLRVLGYLLRRYYEMWLVPDTYWDPARDFWQNRPGSPAQQWHAGPSFNSFFEFMMLEAGRNREPEFEKSYTWLLATSRKYYAGNPLDYLLNALPTQQAELMAAPTRCLYFNWPHGEPLADWPRAYWLLLYTCDTYLSRYATPADFRRLTLITNGLPDDFTEENQCCSTASYVYSWYSFNREIVVGAAQLPGWLLLDSLTSKLLLPGCLESPATAREFGLTSDATALLGQLCLANREVALLVGPQFTVFSALLPPAELAYYQPPGL